MEILKNIAILSTTIALCINLIGCNSDGTVTVITELETDTFISNVSSDNHASLPYVTVQNSSGVESKVLFKLPTGNRDEDGNLEDCLNSYACTIFFLPMVILKAIIDSSCSDSSFTAANLNWAQVEFNTVSGSSVSAGALDLHLLEKPWWHTASWTTAHPFSASGKWSNLGGDLNTSTDFNTNCNGLTSGDSCTGSTVKFEMTNFLKSMLSSPNSTHYGFAIVPTGALSELQLRSVQGTVFGETPRLVANYNCVTFWSKTKRHIYHLGTTP